MRRLALLAVFVSLLTSSATGDISLAWDANPPSERVTHYDVYCSGRIARGFTNYARVTTNVLTVPAQRAHNHFFFVVAVNSNGVSPFRLELLLE